MCKRRSVQTNVWLGENEIYESNTGEYGGYTFEFQNEEFKRKYQGRKVKLGKIGKVMEKV